MLILIAGLPGTGKTTISRAFAALYGAVHLNSDALRRELALMGHYSPEDKKRVYDELLARTDEALKAGEIVVVDSTFYKKNIREPFERLAELNHVPLKWVEVRADERVLRERLSHPRPDSEADYAIYEKIRDQQEPLPEERLIINSEQETPESAAIKIQHFLYEQ
ncbi:MAG: AAA family ATPase [Saprospiraceae bacterium]|nr:AAA family ATPase [Saprospiraceae bacterium]